MTDDFDDPTGFVRRRLEEAGSEITVDVDAEWVHLQDRIRRDREATGGWEPPPSPPPPGPSTRFGSSIVAVAALLVVLVLATRPVTVRIVVDGVASARDAVLGRTEPPPVTLEMPTTAPTVTAPVPTTTAPPPTTTTTFPPTTTTAPAPAAPAIGSDPAHGAITSGDDYRLTIRRVHNQINAAIGYGNRNFAALEGSDARIESVLGVRPEFDAQLRDVIGHLRQAQRAEDRNAASAAHTIIESIEARLAAEG